MTRAFSRKGSDDGLVELRLPNGLGGGVLSVLVRQVVGVAGGDEPGVGPAVMTDHDGAFAEADDLDDVGMALVVGAEVLVIAPMRGLDSAGGHLV